MKKRKYSDGGVTEGENPNIDDDTRARARKWLESGSPEQESGEETPKAKAKPAAKKEEVKYGEDKEKVRQAYIESGRMRTPKADEAKRQAEMVKNEKGLERVTPELDLAPIGKVAAGLGAGYAALKGVGKYMAKKAEESAAKKTAERAAKIAAGKQKARAGRAKSSGAMEDEALSGEFRSGFKKGGSVASRRADGCAMRGKTKGRIY